MKKLFLDIETAPNVCYTWGLFNVNIGIDQLIRPGRMICLSWKFDGQKGTTFASEWGDGTDKMLTLVHKALNEADAVVHFNGRSFDETHLNREFLENDFAPPTKFQTIDLKAAISKRFRFASSKLAHVSDVLELREGKIHTDFTLWSRVLDGDKRAQKEMEKYNREDVELLVPLYERLLPWIPQHPNVALYSGSNMALKACTRCGSENVKKNGSTYTTAGAYDRYRCNDCSAESRNYKRYKTTQLREV